MGLPGVALLLGFRYLPCSATSSPGRAPVSGWKAVVRDWRRRGGDAMRREFEQALEARAGA